ncbi:MAG: hypothetical protein H3C47_10145 [Candidatus Cloacimonetes bacterium]|nr:hypothetical protein [Candidatus Cloacimonadota bacterium]
MRGAGGTSGGIGEFFLGLFMTAAGGYLLTTNIKVSSGFWGLRYNFYGDASITAFGISLIPLIIGFFFLFYDAGSKIGWILSLLSLAFILFGVLSTLQIWFQTTSLFVLILMLVLLFGGLGLVARAIKPH